MGLFFVKKQSTEILDWDLLLRELRDFNAIYDVMVVNYNGFIISSVDISLKREEMVANLIENIRLLNESMKTEIEELQFKIEDKKICIFKFEYFYFIVTLKIDTEKMVYIRIKNILDKNKEVFELYRNSEVFQ